MKTEEAFEPTVWAERLATALETLAPRIGTSVPEEAEGLVRANRSAGIRSHDQYDDSAQKADHDPAPSTAFEECHVWLDGEPSDVMAALREHPVIDQALAGSGEDEEVQLVASVGCDPWGRIWKILPIFETDQLRIQPTNSRQLGLSLQIANCACILFAIS